MSAKLSIIFQTAPLKGLDFAINKPRVTIGRDPNNDIVIDHIEVSRKHAIIEYKDDQVTISDAGSLNGTMVDGKVISGPTVVLPGQTIAVSNAVRFILAEEESEAEKTVVLEQEEEPSIPRKTIDPIEQDDRGLDDFEPFYPDEIEKEADEAIKQFEAAKTKNRNTVLWLIAILIGVIMLGIVLFIWYVDYYALWCDVLPFLFQPGICP